MRRRDPAYCFGICGSAKAPWRPSLDQAHADAIEAGMATKYDGSQTVFMTVPGEIWITHELVPVLPRDPMPVPPAPRPDRPLSRIDRIIARREANG